MSQYLAVGTSYNFPRGLPPRNSDIPSYRESVAGSRYPLRAPGLSTLSAAVSPYTVDRFLCRLYWSNSHDPQYWLSPGHQQRVVGTNPQGDRLPLGSVDHLLVNHGNMDIVPTD